MSGGGAFGIFGDMFQARAGERASESQMDAAAAQGNLQNYMYQQSRADLAPYRHVGTQALNALAEMYGFSGWQGGTDIQAGAPFSTRTEKHNIWKEGLSSGLTPGHRLEFNADALGGTNGGPTTGAGTGGATGTGQPNYDRFLSSPDYQFTMSQGIEAANKQAAAAGRLRSGGQQKALARYAGGVASQQLGTYFNRLAAMAGIGQTATNTGVQSGQGYADAMGNAIGNAGGAAAAGSLYRGNVIGQGFNNLAGNMGNRSGNNGSGDTSLFGGADYSSGYGDSNWSDAGYSYPSTGDGLYGGG